MSEQNTVPSVAETKPDLPRLLNEGEVYAVKVGQHFFGDFDEDGYPVRWNFPHAETLETAQERLKQLQGNEHVHGELSIVKVIKDRQGEITFWVEDDGDGVFSSRSVGIAPYVRHEFEDMPGWFKAAMMTSDPTNSGWDDYGYEDYVVAWEIFHNQTRGEGRGFLDHFGWSGQGEDSYFVSEPYHLEAEDIQNLVEVCQKFNFDFQISGRSNHYPSETMQIMIRPRIKLSYTKRVRLVSPERLEWEARRDAAELKLNLTLACDFIDHVMHLADEMYKEDFVARTAILRGIAEHKAYEGARYLEEASSSLDFAVEAADYVVRDLYRCGISNTPDIEIARAIAQAARSNGRRQVLRMVDLHCAEAIDQASWLTNGRCCANEAYVKARKSEEAWQEEHSRPAIEAFRAEWKDEEGR